MEIFTCSIFPHLTRIWYDYTHLVLGDSIPITIYDCSGALPQEWAKGATIKKFKNLEHGKKINHFVKGYTPDLLLITDDDAFIRVTSFVTEIQKQMEGNDNLAIYSGHERDHWNYKVNEEIVWPIGTYTFAVNTKIVKKEDLFFESVKTTEQWVNNGKGYWDTANYMQYQLLQKGYDIESIPLSIDSPVSTLYGTSSGFITWYKKRFFSKEFCLKKNTKNLLEDLPKNKYLFERTLGVVAVMDIYTQLYGKSSLSFPLSWEELLELGKHFSAEDGRTLDRINDFKLLMKDTLLAK